MKEQLRLLLSDHKPALYLFRRAVLIVLGSKSELEMLSRDWGAILALANGAGYGVARTSAHSSCFDNALAALAPIETAKVTGYAL